MAYVEKRISFDYERDKDLIDFMDSMTSHKANQLVRQLLRDYMRDERNSQLDRIENKLNRIASDIANNTFSTSATAGVSPDGMLADAKLAEITFNLEKIGI